MENIYIPDDIEQATQCVRILCNYYMSITREDIDAYIMAAYLVNGGERHNEALEIMNGVSSNIPDDILRFDKIDGPTVYSTKLLPCVWLYKTVEEYHQCDCCYWEYIIGRSGITYVGCAAWALVDIIATKAGMDIYAPNSVTISSDFARRLNVLGKEILEFIGGESVAKQLTKENR